MVYNHAIPSSVGVGLEGGRYLDVEREHLF